MLRVLGIISIILGLGLIIATATGALYHDQAYRGYLVGGVIAIAGAVRFVRGTNR